MLSFIFIKEIKKLPAGGGVAGSDFFTQLKEKKHKNNMRQFFINNKLLQLKKIT
jgi:hypothetical protein